MSGMEQDVCKGARFPVEGKRCVVSGGSLFKRLEVNEEEEEVRRGTSRHPHRAVRWGNSGSYLEPMGLLFLLYYSQA